MYFKDNSIIGLRMDHTARQFQTVFPITAKSTITGTSPRIHDYQQHGERPLRLYEQAATDFTDREWKARALFMASSCTMDLYAQNWWDNWNNILDPDFKRSDEEKKVDSYFYQLAKSYSDTQFFSKLCTNASILTTT